MRPRFLPILLLGTALTLGCAGDSTGPGEPSLSGYTDQGTQPADAELLTFAGWIGSAMTNIALTHPDWSTAGYSWAPPAPGLAAMLAQGPRTVSGSDDRVCNTVLDGSATDANGNGIADHWAVHTTCDEVDTIGGRILQHRDSMVGVMDDSVPGGTAQNFVAHVFTMMRYTGEAGFDSGWSHAADEHVVTNAEGGEFWQSDRWVSVGIPPGGTDSMIHGNALHSRFTLTMPVGVTTPYTAGLLALEGTIYRFTVDPVTGHADSAAHTIVLTSDPRLTFGEACPFPTEGWLQGHLASDPEGARFLAHFSDCDPYPHLYWTGAGGTATVSGHPLTLH